MQTPILYQSFVNPPIPLVAWNTVISEIGASSIVNNGLYTGSGVRIGIDEAEGVCDVNNSNLIGKNIVIVGSTNTSDHATRVTSITALIAPNATFYANGNNNSIGIGWFITVQCDIVNCSYAFCNNIQNNDGTYTDGVKTYRADIDGVYDYQIQVHGITCVMAAGNYCDNEYYSGYNPQNRVCSPGLAYNAITVGGVKRAISWSGYVLKHEDEASFVSDLPYVKPEISAFFTVNVPAMGADSGTSYSAPQVSGCCALLMQKSNAYKGNPRRVKAALMVGASKTNDYVEDRGRFDNHVGAGCVNLYNTAFISSSTNTSVPAGSPIGSEPYSCLRDLNAGDTLIVSLAWEFVRSGSDSSTAGLTDYDIRIYGPGGNLVAGSNNYFTTVELVRLNVETTGTYKIVVYQKGLMPSWNTIGDRLTISQSVR